MAQQPNIDMETLERMMTGPRPIPGQSLTNNPDNSLPFERPTKFVEVQPALDQLFLELTDENTIDKLEDVLSRKIPVATIAEQILFKGFSEGLWNPDLMMLLLEPTIYMIMSIADRVGVENVVLEEGDDPEAVDLDDAEKARRYQEATKALIKHKKQSGQMNQMMKEEPTPKAKEKPKPRSLLSKEEG